MLYAPRMSSASDFSFPFIGAGEASYFEWAEVHVEFARAPSEAERIAISDSVPPPLRDSIDFVASHLMVASDQFAHVVMAEAYSDAADESDIGADESDTGGGNDNDNDNDNEDDNEDDDDGGDEDDNDDDLGRFFAASPAQVHAFNSDTDAWLAHSHEICPILVAFRAEDGESGGTEPSPWHLWSLTRVVALLDNFASVLTASEDENDGGRAHMVRGMLALASANAVELPREFAEWLDPGRDELAAISAGDSATLRTLLAAGISPQILDKLGDEVDDDDDDQYRTLLAVADLLIAAESLTDELKIILASIAARTRHDPQAPAALASRAEAVLAAAPAWAELDTDMAELIGGLGYDLTTGGSFAAAIDLFDLLVDIEGLAKTTYCNALWVIQRDNNKLPLDPARARHFLARCLAHGPDNPAIFYNAACVHMELGERALVLSSLEAAVTHGYTNIDGMKNEPLFAPIADSPEFVAVFADAGKNP